MDSTIARYPLLFEFHEVIVGCGFLSGIRINGRAIAEREAKGEWWIFGVHPGAIAEQGSSLQGAVGSFRLRMKALFIDLAEEAPDFSAFKREVESFFNATSPETEQEWEAARQDVRAGRLTLAELPKVSDTAPPRITVEELELAPGANLLDDNPYSIAA